MDIDDLPNPIKFAYISMSRSAIHFKKTGKDRDFFVEFAREIWNSMELSDIDDLKNVLEQKMESEIKPHIESYIRNKKRNK